mmetsp:Transcript_16735/g.54710  ORF Transcript_16735/g.54710 Transcript_16735/m.54710 type:complete len:350 (+) Transcript_16735:279-1328(+)
MCACVCPSSSLPYSSVYGGGGVLVCCAFDPRALRGRGVRGCAVRGRARSDARRRHRRARVRHFRCRRRLLLLSFRDGGRGGRHLPKDAERLCARELARLRERELERAALEARAAAVALPRWRHAQGLHELVRREPRARRALRRRREPLRVRQHPRERERRARLAPQLRPPPPRLCLRSPLLFRFSTPPGRLHRLLRERLERRARERQAILQPKARGSRQRRRRLHRSRVLLNFHRVRLLTGRARERLSLRFLLPFPFCFGWGEHRLRRWCAPLARIRLARGALLAPASSPRPVPRSHLTSPVAAEQERVRLRSGLGRRGCDDCGRVVARRWRRIKPGTILRQVGRKVAP